MPFGFRASILGVLAALEVLGIQRPLTAEQPACHLELTTAGHGS